jgi:hypothetical protein
VEGKLKVQYVKKCVVRFRNFYTALMILPLWLWSIYYRTGQTGVHWKWLEAQWNLACILVMLEGALTIWQYAEMAVKKQYQGEDNGLLIGGLWALALTVFIASVGATIAANGTYWGKGLFLIGVLLIPFFAMFLLYMQIHEHTESRKNQKEAPPQPIEQLVEVTEP